MGTIVNRDPKTGRNLGSDLIGVQSGQLTVIAATPRRCPNGYKIWRAQCSCGKVIELPSYLFVKRIGHQKSCGCGPTGRPRIPDQGSHVNMAFAHYRRSAGDRNLPFLLSREEFFQLIKGDCAYCGLAPPLRPTHANLSGDFHWNGIDRLDSTQGYVFRNCVSCCKSCNVAKATMSLDEFKEWVARVAGRIHLWPK